MMTTSPVAATAKFQRRITRARTERTVPSTTPVAMTSAEKAGTGEPSKSEVMGEVPLMLDVELGTWMPADEAEVEPLVGNVMNTWPSMVAAPAELVDSLRLDWLNEL